MFIQTGQRMIPGGHHHQLLLNNRNKIDIWLIGNIRADRQIDFSRFQLLQQRQRGPLSKRKSHIVKLR